MYSIDRMRRNFRHLYADIFWFGVLSGSTIAFISIYSARLGSSAFQIGLLTAGPALVNLFFSLPTGSWLADRSLISVTFWSALFQRLFYLALIPLPWLLDAPDQIRLIILLTLLMSVPGTVLAIGFNALFAEIVPAQYRAEVVGQRNALLAVSVTASTLVCGQLLDRIAFPLNYQILFGVGALGALLSTYHVGQLRPAQLTAHEALPKPPDGSLRFDLDRLRRTPRLSLARKVWRGTLSGDWLHISLPKGRFALFLSAYLLFYSFQYFCIPLFPLAYVNELNLSDGMISLGTGLFYAAVFLVSLRLKSLAVRFGHQRLLASSAIALSAYPLLIGLARGPFLYWVASGVGGVVFGLLNASLLNRLMERVPEADRPGGMAYHNLVLSLGILIGSLAGPWVGELMGLREALLAGAGLRLLAGLLMVLWG